MKSSKYNILFERNGSSFIFNTLSGSFAKFDDDDYDLYQAISLGNPINEQDELISRMKRANFIIEEHTDERAWLKSKNRYSKYFGDQLSLTIAPTMDCNFACPYCFEKHKKGFMNEEIQEKLIDYVKNQLPNIKKLHINWFGGEPLLEKAIIQNLSNQFQLLCQQFKVNYTASIITNGYLIDNDTINLLKQEKIHTIQITIDGLEKKHNSRRKLLNGDGTFQSILTNVQLLYDHNFHVGIRINIDQTNDRSAFELADFFAKKRMFNLHLSLGLVSPYTDACKSVETICIESENFATITYQFIEHLTQLGFTKAAPSYLIKRKSKYCSATDHQSFVIDAEGFFYKCWNDIGIKEKALFQIMEANEASYIQNNRYLSWDPFSYQKCMDCAYLPLCLGGCPFNGMKENEPRCDTIKYYLNDLLTLISKKKLSANEVGAF